MNLFRPAIIGPIGPAQLACVASWRSLGLESCFIHVSDGPDNRLLSRNVVAYMRISSSALFSEGGIDQVGKFLTEHCCKGITCVSEELARFFYAQKKNLPSDLMLWMAEPSVLDILRAKSNQIRLAHEAGFDLLPTWLVGYFSHLNGDNLPDEAFPVVVRPDGQGTVTPAFKVKLVQNRRELTELLANLVLSAPLIVQPFVEGPNLVVHGYRRVDGFSEHTAFFADMKFNGVSLSIKPAKLPSGLAQNCIDFLKNVGIVGCYHFEFVVSHAQEKQYFLEMNGRLGGTTAKVFACGYNEPGLLLYAHGFIEKKPDDLSLESNCIAFNRKALFEYWLNCMRGLLSRLDHPYEKRVATSIKVFYGAFKWQDEIQTLRPRSLILAYYWDGISNLIKKLKSSWG